MKIADEYGMPYSIKNWKHFKKLITVLSMFSAFGMYILIKNIVGYQDTIILLMVTIIWRMK